MTVIGQPCWRSKSQKSHLMTAYALVRHHDQLPSMTPVLHHTQHLPGPVGQCPVRVTAFFVVPL